MRHVPLARTVGVRAGNDATLEPDGSGPREAQRILAHSGFWRSRVPGKSSALHALLAPLRCPLRNQAHSAPLPPPRPSLKGGASKKGGAADQISASSGPPLRLAKTS
jgi:hypothetical protein